MVQCIPQSEDFCLLGSAEPQHISAIGIHPQPRFAYEREFLALIQRFLRAARSQHSLALVYVCVRARVRLPSATMCGCTLKAAYLAERQCGNERRKQHGKQSVSVQPRWFFEQLRGRNQNSCALKALLKLPAPTSWA